MKTREIILYFGLLILLFGCSQISTIFPKATTSEPTTITTGIPTVSTQPSPATEVMPMVTLTSPIVVSTVTMTQSVTPLSPTNPVDIRPTPPIEILRYVSLEKKHTLSPDEEVTGTLILSGNYIFGPFNTPGKDLDAETYFWDIVTGEKVVLASKGDHSIVTFDVSPDRKWLAYGQLNISGETASRFVITSARGMDYTQIPWEENWGYFEWIDDERIMISKAIGLNAIDKQRGEAGKFSLILLNPFTGQRQEQLPDLPDIWSPDPCWYAGCMLFDPTGERILYSVMKSELPFVLWDVQTGKEIARIPYGEAPKWSPDGKKLAYICDVGPEIKDRNPWYQAHEFFIAGLDGQVTRLTHLTEYLPYVSIPAYSWSPDGSYIAFWMSTGRNLAYNLAVLNIVTGQVTNYLIEADFEKGTPFPDYLVLTNDAAPIWSPDGHQLLFSTRDTGDESRRLVMLVDIVRSYVATIAENMIPVGWMVSP